MVVGSRVPGALVVLGGSLVVATVLVLEIKGHRYASRSIAVTGVITGGILSAIRYLTDTTPPTRLG